MPMNYATFIDQVSKQSRFDRLLLQKFYQKQIYDKNTIKYAQYEQEFQEMWNTWVEESRNSMAVSQFFVNYGDKIFRAWLRIFFPFNTGEKQLILGIRAGGTPEDFVIHMFYRFSLQELSIIDDCLTNYKIREISQRSALTRIFLESFLSMRPIISKIVGYKYTLLVVESKILKKLEGRILHLEIAARPSE
ncbi:MAG: hypothetical protein ACFFD2_30145 [Promethearchaeota archaeon]